MSNILITGSGGGIGTALAKAFLREGHNLLLHYRNRTCDLESEHKYSNQVVEYVKGDLRNPEIVYRVVSQAQDFGVNVLVNNAAVHWVDDFANKDRIAILSEMHINAVVPILLVNGLWDNLSKNGRGLIVNINSLAGKFGSQGESVYCASKHALSGFSKALRFDGTSKSIRVLNVILGAAQTTMSNGREDFDKLIDPDELAETIVQLCKVRETLNIDEVVITRRNY